MKPKFNIMFLYSIAKIKNKLIKLQQQQNVKMYAEIRSTIAKQKYIILFLAIITIFFMYLLF